MAMVKLTKANEQGQSVGDVYINTDQIVSISKGVVSPNVTEIRMTDGLPHWVAATPDEVAAAAKG